jgi:DhnA family fructose-bisphosphate aldolase class Ia
MTSLGKTIHIQRMRNPASGRILTVALDHAPSYGVLAGLENLPLALQQVAEGEPNAVLLMPGTAARCFGPYAGRMALLVKCSTVSPYHPTEDVWVRSVEDVLRLGADAIAMALTVGSVAQPQLLRGLGQLVRDAEAVGLPVIAHAYPCGDLVPAEERYSLERVRYAARLAMEVGVDIVKTFYTGSTESFARVVEAAAPALVVAAGGPRLETEADALQMARDVVQAGAAGITYGRNIWQSSDTPRMIRALKHVVHQGGSVGEALAILSDSGQAMA